MLSYEGIFFDDDASKFIHSLENERLPIENDKLHCTFKYHPKDDEILNELVGKEIEVFLIGYASDGQNSGFQVLLPDDIGKYYYDMNKSEIPHITASISENAKSLDTGSLKFKPLGKKYSVIGKFGYWIKENKCEYVSYDKYEK